MLRFVSSRLVEAMLAASMVIARAVSAIGDFREPNLFMVSAVLSVVGPMAGKNGAKQRLLAESSWTIRGSSSSKTWYSHRPWLWGKFDGDGLQTIRPSSNELRGSTSRATFVYGPWLNGRLNQERICQHAASCQFRLVCIPRLCVAVVGRFALEAAEVVVVVVGAGRAYVVFAKDAFVIRTA